MKKEFHAVQKAARSESKGKHGFAYFMEQGLGKTLTTLDEFLELVAADEVSRLVVLCPNSFKGGWVEEIEKWGLEIEPHVFEADEAEWVTRRWMERGHNRPPLLIVNYEAIRSPRVTSMICDFVDGHGAMIAADESIQISTFDAAQTKAAIGLAKEFEYRRILSGKWVKKGPHDLWSQLRFIGLLNGYNYFAFKTRFCKMGGFKGNQVVGIKDGMEDDLASLYADNVFEARKNVWAPELPPKSWTRRRYVLNSALSKHYQDMLEDFVVYMDDDKLVTVESAITKYIKLAQIQCGFIIDEQGNAQQLVDDKENPRLKALNAFIDDELTGKICVPYHHRHSLPLLQRALARLRPVHIGGGMSRAEIDANKRQFAEDRSCGAILLQTRASKYGHTLLGDQSEDAFACNTMAFWENTYNFDDRSQIEDRPHRHGQKRAVSYIDLVGTEIDNKMCAAYETKEDMFQTLRAAINAYRGQGD